MMAIPDYPRLRVLDISRIELNFNDIRATQIQELDVKFKPSNGSVWGPLAAFLDRNPLLHTIRLELRGKHEDEEGTESSTRLASQATRCLQLGVYPGCRLNDLLEKVEMPELRQLVIKPAQEAKFLVFDGERADLGGIIETCIRNFGLLTEIRIKGLSDTSVTAVREDFAELASGKLDLALWIDSEKFSS
ncbi:hypothetical protein FRB90_009027 [Tulasnella sp. 427]|nr:hypothetical protein FRB90_009027 [Tulasnella sp. 427]